MTGAEGDQHHGWWQIIAVDPPHHLSFEDGFAHGDGAVDDGLPTMLIEVELTAHPRDKTVMAILTTFPTLAAMNQILEMGHEAGMIAALGQIDDVLAGVATN